ncbi:MAG: glycosyl transferase family 2 [Phascolarctobacterium sp.]|nr:MAG: glycosyl transferase family 2 [Phascolarctobacterium sp.]
MNSNIPLVSVVCTCYNHGKYIREALDSILKQKTNFMFEVIVHDDASTDNSAEIIKEYYNNYPDIIVPILQTENQYSKNVRINSTFIYPKVRGKYIALCECDDYWIDDTKLQKQVEYLESHAECSACIHSAYKVDATTKKVLKQIVLSDVDRDFSINEAIEGLGSNAATNSFIFRSKYIPDFLKFYNMLPNTGVGDYLILVFLSILGKIHYKNEFMSVYRGNVNNSWTDIMRNSIFEHIQYLNKHIELLNGLFDIIPKEYHKILQQYILKKEYSLALLKGNILTAKKYPCLYKYLTTKEKVKVIIRYLLLSLDKTGKLYDNITKINQSFRKTNNG